MPLRFDLHLLTSILVLISSASLTHTDASINTVEEFLDTLINSSRYDRRIRPFFDQHSQLPTILSSPVSSSSRSRGLQCHHDYSYQHHFGNQWSEYGKCKEERKIDAMPLLWFTSLGLQYRFTFSTIMVRSTPELFRNRLGREIPSNHLALLTDWSYLGTRFILSQRQRRKTKWYHCAQSIDSHSPWWSGPLQSTVSFTVACDSSSERKTLHGLCFPLSRLFLKLDCQMKLQKFPLDNQTCVVNIGSCK